MTKEKRRFTSFLNSAIKVRTIAISPASGDTHKGNTHTETNSTTKNEEGPPKKKQNTRSGKSTKKSINQ